jgi:hypothetical protein
MEFAFPNLFPILWIFLQHPRHHLTEWTHLVGIHQGILVQNQRAAVQEVFIFEISDII